MTRGPSPSLPLGPGAAPTAHLPALRALVVLLEDDLRQRCEDEPEVGAKLRSTYDQVRGGELTAQTFSAWRDEYLTQVAVAWVLACVFVRFLEDQELLKPEDVRLAGLDASARAQVDAAYQDFIRRRPADSDREYLLEVFDRCGAIPAARDLIAEGKTPLRALGPGPDGARKLREFFLERDPETGGLLRTFRTPGGDTRFLGDLYQELSESAKKRYALLQTPDFIEEFILDRTLEPAIDELGLADVRLIDPACGSGHFLLGAFHRLFARWSRERPGESAAQRAERALDQVHGIDLNPFAVAIARFRLIVAALRAAGFRRLAEAPAWRIHVATGDSLLHGERYFPSGDVRTLNEMRLVGERWQESLYGLGLEDEAAFHEILTARAPYSVVVGNPPYITVKDKARNALYRARFETCHRKYSLGVPFTQRFFELARAPNVKAGDRRAGYVGMITTNSFMKREFGKKLIEAWLPGRELTHLIDTSGAYYYSASFLAYIHVSVSQAGQRIMSCMHTPASRSSRRRRLR